MAQNSGVGENYFIPHPRTMRVNFFPFDVFDYVWTSLIFVACLLLAQSWGDFGSLAWLVFGAIWFVTMWPIFPTMNERLYYLGLVAPFKELYFHRKKGYIWRKGQKEKYPYEVREFGKMGLIYTLDRQTYSMIFSMKGSPVAALSLVSQYGHNAQHAEILRRASASTGLRGLELTLGYDIRPENPFAVRYELALGGDLNVVLPEALVNGTPESEYTAKDHREVFRRQIANEMELMALDAPQVSMVAVFTIKDNRVFRRILRQGMFYSHQVRRETLVRIRENLTTLLRTVYEGVEMLNGDQAEEYLRKSRDIAEIYEFYSQMDEFYSDEEQRRTMQGDESFVPSSDRPVYHAPFDHIIANPESLTMDGTSIALIRLTEFPLDQPPVDYLREYSSVFNLPVPFFSLNVSGKTKKGSLQSFIKGPRETFMDTTLEMVGNAKGGSEQDEVNERREAERQRLKASYTIDFKPSVVILAANQEDLDSQVLSTIDLLREKNLGPVHVKGRFRQWREVLSTVTHLP